MKMRSGLQAIAIVVALAGVALVLGGCFGIPKETTKSVKVGEVTIQADGAGITKADAQTVSFKIRCVMCGFGETERTVDIPKSGESYVLDWVCPKCGHKQKIVIRVAGK